MGEVVNLDQYRKRRRAESARGATPSRTPHAVREPETRAPEAPAGGDSGGGKGRRPRREGGKPRGVPDAAGTVGD